jgi:hypothetical protein
MDFIEGIKTVGNSVGINNISSYFLVFFILFFTIILSVYIERIFSLIKSIVIYQQKYSFNILFLFINFLVVLHEDLV